MVQTRAYNHDKMHRVFWTKVAREHANTFAGSEPPRLTQLELFEMTSTLDVPIPDDAMDLCDNSNEQIVIDTLLDGSHPFSASFSCYLDVRHKQNKQETNLDNKNRRSCCHPKAATTLSRQSSSKTSRRRSVARASWVG